MTTIYMATDEALVMIHKRGVRWHATRKLEGLRPQCVAVDPGRPERVYCGTFGRGLWRSQDAGATWQLASEGITQSQVMAVAVSPVERAGELGVVWAGTEPSAIFRSEDGGDTWLEQPALRKLPSAPTWSFPPRPYTSHVRWITPDPNRSGLLLAAIEAGGVMRSMDGGSTWEDRKPTGPYDAHTMAAHRLAPGRVYASAGDGFGRAGAGYAESRDGGETWERFGEGLRHHYLWGLAVDPTNPDTVVISAAHGPQQAHNPHVAEAAIYRRTAGEPWQHVQAGLPDPKGTRVYSLAANEAEPGAFYAATHEGQVFRSPDAGLTWERLDIAWPEGRGTHSGMPAGLAVVEND